MLNSMNFDFLYDWGNIHKKYLYMPFYKQKNQLH